VRKVLTFAVLFTLLISVAGCNFKQAEINPSNSGAQIQTKFVHIDSDPQGAMVYIDNNAPITTPTDIELTPGWHYINFKKDGYEDYIIKNAEVKEDTTIISVTLKKSIAEELAEVGRVLVQLDQLGLILFHILPAALQEQLLIQIYSLVELIL